MEEIEQLRKNLGYSHGCWYNKTVLGDFSCEDCNKEVKMRCRLDELEKSSVNVELTNIEIGSIQEAIEAAWSDGFCGVSYETLLKLGFKEDHYILDHLRKYDRGSE